MAILQTDEIDLVVLNTAELPLLMNILKTKKIIADKAPHERHIFESVTMRKYFDFSVKESGLLKRRYFHGWGIFNPTKIIGILKNDLQDFMAFKDSVLDFLKTERSQNQE